MSAPGYEITMSARHEVFLTEACAVKRNLQIMLRYRPLRHTEPFRHVRLRVNQESRNEALCLGDFTCYRTQWIKVSENHICRFDEWEPGASAPNFDQWRPLHSTQAQSVARAHGFYDREELARHLRINCGGLPFIGLTLNLRPGLPTAQPLTDQKTENKTT